MLPIRIMPDFKVSFPKTTYYIGILMSNPGSMIITIEYLPICVYILHKAS